MGVPAEAVWALSAHLTEQLPAYQEQGLERADRQRALGGGGDFAQPLGIRVALVLTYWRLHLAQAAGAQLYGATQSEVARELGRLRPVLQAVLPCPAVWQQLAAGADLSPEQGLEWEQLAARRALSDTTEQRVARPTESTPRKAQYAGTRKLDAQDPARHWWRAS